MQMLLTIKITSLAWNVHDYADKKDMEKELKNKDIHHHKAKVLNDRLARCQPTPSLLAYMGYCYHFSGLLAGPAFELVDYMSGTVTPPVDPATGKEPKGRYYGAFMQTLKAVANILIFILGNAWLGYHHIYIPEVLALPTLKM